MAKTSLKNALGICPKDKINRKNALGTCPKDKINRKNALGTCPKDKINQKNALGSSPKGKISRIYENLNTSFGKTGSERQNQTVYLKGFLYNRIAILFFTHYLKIE
ncbi:MAG: hypothetical protein LBL33_06500 [Tannerella sp.]|jgi:hypothetical protein|nr:hypothetical protein [Tannerella sp.]